MFTEKEKRLLASPSVSVRALANFNVAALLYVDFDVELKDLRGLEMGSGPLPETLTPFVAFQLQFIVS